MEQTQVRVDQQLAATTVDTLAATDLRQAPGPGAIAVWAISSVTDSAITVRIGNRQMASAIACPTGTLIDTEIQAPIAMTQVRGGENIRVDVTEVTAMAFHLTVVWSGILT
ncbi:MAG TPA: hypothetical protein EYN66_03045 [Myxococcales bacterium]|jgi:hypothetical protein|nr:hypothetical protein [Myxococcales bacterium]